MVGAAEYFQGGKAFNPDWSAVALGRAALVRPSFDGLASR